MLEIKKQEKHIARKLTLIMITLTIVTTIMLNLSAKMLYPTIINYANMQLNKLSTLIINNAIDDSVNDNLFNEEIIDVVYQESGIASSVGFNINTINKIASNTSNQVYNNLKYIETGQIDKIEYDNLDLDIDLLKKGFIYEIPYGMAFNNTLIASSGPKLPVKFELSGDIKSNVISNITQYGINNALIEVVLSLKIKMQVIIPLCSNVNEAIYDIPLALKVITGLVPTYYQGSNTIDDKFIIPIV